MKLLENKTWRLFFTALVFGVVAAISTVLYLKIAERRIEARLQPAQQKFSAVVVAARDLVIGDKVTSDTVAVRKIPSIYVASDAITPTTYPGIEGAILTKNLAHGRVVTEDIIDLNIPKDFSATIKEGHRAVTISVDDLNSISGLIRPGDYIDVYSRLSASSSQVTKENSRGDIIIPVLDMAFVLATGKKAARPNEDEFNNFQDVQRSSKTYSTVTLELSPKKAGLVAVAREEGDLIAVLRNKDDHGGPPFQALGRGDLFANSREMQEEAYKKLYNNSADSVGLQANGTLATKGGTLVTAPNITLNKAGLLTTKDGKILTGRGLSVDSSGKIVDEHGARLKTDSLTPGNNGVLVDKNGNVLQSNGYHTLPGGFIEDQDGNIMTPDGKILHGVELDKNGNVVTDSGQILTAQQVHVNKDGSVSILKSRPLPPGVHRGKDGKLYDKNGKLVTKTELAKLYEKAAKIGKLHVNAQGQLVDSQGNVVTPSDVLSVDPDGTVRAADGTILPGVHRGKDGKFYDKNGKLLTNEDLAKLYNKATKTGKLHLNAQGQLVDSQGNVVKASDVLSVDPDGTVRTADGTILPGVHRGKDGKFYDRNGKLLTNEDLAKLYNKAQAEKSQPLAGVTATDKDDFVQSFQGKGQENLTRLIRQVEFIVGGGSSGVAKSFTVSIKDFNRLKKETAEKTTK